MSKARPIPPAGAQPVRIVIVDPDGCEIGKGDVKAYADAMRVRPQDCAPRARAILFGREPLK